MKNVQGAVFCEGLAYLHDPRVADLVLRKIKGGKRLVVPQRSANVLAAFDPNAVVIYLSAFPIQY